MKSTVCTSLVLASQATRDNRGLKAGESLAGERAGSGTAGVQDSLSQWRDAEEAWLKAT